MLMQFRVVLKKKKNNRIQKQGNEMLCVTAALCSLADVRRRCSRHVSLQKMQFDNMCDMIFTFADRSVLRFLAEVSKHQRTH